MSLESCSFPNQYQPQMRVAEKLAESQNYETLAKVAHEITVGCLVTSLSAFLLCYMANAPKLDITVNPNVNPFSAMLSNSKIIGPPLAIWSISVVTAVCKTFFTEKAKDLQSEAQTLLNIIDNKPITIIKA